MRRTLLVVALVTGLLAATHFYALAGATAETCRGLTATLVGSPDAVLTGTPGPDVVVTNGARSVVTGDGDDVVCTTNTPARSSGVDVEVDAGPGDDVVDTTAERGNPVAGTTLGDGDDAFDGGPPDDSVDARDAGHDTVRTGGGNDFVGTGSGTGVDADFVDTEASGDQLFVDGTVSVVSQLSGGDGRDNLVVNVPSAGRWVFDNRTGEVRHDGVTTWRWAHVEQFFFGQTKAVGRISFVGGPEEELLYVTTSAFAGARLGAGNDDVYVGSPRLAGRPAVRAGAGRDHLFLLPYGTQAPVHRAELDLGSGPLRYVDRKGRRTSLLVTGFEGADVHGRSVRIIGSRRDDTLVAWSCDVELQGRAGQDYLGMLTQDECGPSSRRAFFGGPGDDRLIGSGHADLLVGGPGRDRADGNEGRDRCAAEVRTSCELPLSRRMFA